MRIEKIRLDEVKKAYGDIKALEDISLSLYQGELLCVAGLSGSGKSVLADIISGRMPKDVQRQGKDVCGRQTGCVYIHPSGPDCRNLLRAV